MSTSPFRWRFPNRKPSTPFFPGAWPGGSAGEDHSGIQDARVLCSEDINALSRGSSSPRAEGDAAELSHLDHVTDFHQRISHSFNHPGTSRSAQPALAPLSFSVSQNSQLTTLSEITDSSTTPSSPIIPTPEPLSPTAFSQRSKCISSSSRYLVDEDPVSSSCSFEKDKSNNPNRVHHSNDISAPSSPDSSRRLSVRRLCKLAPGLPPLSLPSHSLSFSPDSIASYFTSPQSNSLGDANSPPPPSSPYSSSSAPRSCAISSPGQNAHQEPVLILESPEGIASTFFPVPEDEDPDPDPHPLHALHSPSTFVSTDASVGDSPVLPSDEGPSPSLTTGRLHPSQSLTPSSADMDAFGLAASCILSDSRSTASIPTSFQSTSAAEFTSVCSLPLSAGDTARGHAYRQSSVSLSLSLSLSSGMRTEHGEHFTYGSREDLGYMRARRSTAPSPSPSRTSRPMHVPRTVSGHVIALHRRPENKQEGKSGKLFTFETVKKLGGRIKKLFRKRTSSANGDGVGVITTTAVTAVEYTSEHPIPRSNSRARRATPKSKWQASAKQRRQSMPARTGSAPDISRPRPLRPVSFLAMGNSSDGSSSRPLLSVPRMPSFSHHRRHSHSRRSVQQPRTPENRSRSEVGGPNRDNDSVIDIRAEPKEHAFAPRGRNRTQTAPQTKDERHAAKTRRFSLTSGLTKAKLDAFRTAVKPHPPLPPHAQEVARDAKKRLSNVVVAGTSSGSAALVAETALGPDKVTRSMIAIQKQPEQTNVPTTQHSVRGAGSGPQIEGANMVAIVRQDQDHLRRGQNLSRRSLMVAESSCGPELIRLRTQVPSSHPVQAQSQPEDDADVAHTSQEQVKGRSRGFSLSSTISKRAQRARSMIVGRGSERDIIPAPSATTIKNSAKGVTTTVSEGVSFDMITAGRSSRQTHRGPAALSGFADYDPEVELDNMSFAMTPEITSGAESGTDLSLTPDVAHTIPILTKEMTLNTSISGSTAAGDDMDADADEMEREREEREEERGFMRALGLEFEEILKRARDH